MNARPSTINIPRDLHAYIRATVRMVREQTGRRYSLAQFVREAFNSHLRELWNTFNDGQPVVPDDEPLRPGRGS